MAPRHRGTSVPRSADGSAASRAASRAKDLQAGAGDDGAATDDRGRTAFFKSYTDEPHATRRQLILAKYSKQLLKLYGPHWATKYFVVVSVALQVFMAYAVRELSWPWLLVCAYTVGGVINHSLTLAMHEISHNLAFRSLTANRIIGFLANCPLGIPSFIQFKRYHREHHKFQGEKDVDSDIPTEVEGRVVTNMFAKIIWVFCQPLFYALRPVLATPKKPGVLEAVNYAIVFGFDFAIYSLWGAKACAYLPISTLLGMGLHPMAGHFIAEHYMFIKGQETYSYYGPLNWFSYNVGYHNEHHDFPNIAGFRLPELRAMAPEYYDNLPHHSSWAKIIYEYITDPSVGPFSRVQREGSMDAEVKARILRGDDA